MAGRWRLTYNKSHADRLEPNVQYILFRINSRILHHGNRETSSLFVGIAHFKIVI